ncbi:unnamed protein product [Blepharisma stoltei]|uniref:DUF3447 domain-containing protein n=1 Tax=Blepharisma stoltei TaxID=1481888 RepID=A0AAU9INE6_9CILI|nr:unnamed protein product [Blepharisma stoltei]
MGCCSSNLKESQHQKFCIFMKECITRSDFKGIESLVRSSRGETWLDEKITIAKGLSLNALGFALWLGKIDIFVFLHTTFKADLLQCELILEKQSTSILEIICKQGYGELMDYYLPIYLENFHDNAHSKAVESLTIDLEKSKLYDYKPKGTYTPIQIACEKGYINILSSVHTFFKEYHYCPSQLDIDYQDEKTGENCALIACKQGNFSMIKFLHEVCSANFKAINRKNEGALQILAAASKKKPAQGLYTCFEYLVETVKVDVMYMYEETLLLTDNKAIIGYIENKLLSKGVRVKKVEIEAKIMGENASQANFSNDSIYLDLKKCLDNDDDKKSMPSSVFPVENDTGFCSSISII